ncbi:hypothetical protein DFH09DRAFT_1124750 [Mycena vulgaris]|nr:hypothetical protein DFH09DRAFT_1124750 [Mycena vulgaris]
MDVLESDNFAVLLGLKITDRNLPDGQEVERHARLMFDLRRNGQKTEEQQDIVWSRFCALYLPATINRLLHLPLPTDATFLDEREMVADFVANNPWHEMLVRIQHIPYFAKYLRSSSPIAAAGKCLPQILAERLAHVSDRWEKKMTEIPRNEEKREYYKAAAGSAIQLLSTLCTHFVNEPDRSAVISHETQRQLVAVLTIWTRRYNGQFLGDVSLRMLVYMSEVTTVDQAFNKVRKLNKNWDVCGLPSCSVRKELKVCSRCQTCSPEHQKKDWHSAAGSSHKLSCYETEY